MRKIETPLRDLYVVELDTYSDYRGWFCESYNQEKFKELGLDYTFVQDNHSFSQIGVVRGLHFQTSPGQAKLIRCIRGSIWDVAVDLRKGSSTYKQWFGVELGESINTMLMIPTGFAHGFSALQASEVQYKCSSVYDSKTECGFRYDDPDINVDWKVKYPIVSERDSEAKTFKEIEELL